MSTMVHVRLYTYKWGSLHETITVVFIVELSYTNALWPKMLFVCYLKTLTRKVRIW